MDDNYFAEYIIEYLKENMPGYKIGYQNDYQGGNAPKRFIYAKRDCKDCGTTIHMGIWISEKDSNDNRNGIAIGEAYIGNDNNVDWIDTNDPKCFEKVVDYIKEKTL